MDPGFGRLLPMPSFGSAAPLVMFCAILSFGVAGMVADLIVRRRIHPAYLWGVGAIVLMDVAIGPLAFAPPTVALLGLIESF